MWPALNELADHAFGSAQFSPFPSFTPVFLPSKFSKHTSGKRSKGSGKKCNRRDFVIPAGVVHGTDVDWSISCRFLGVALAAHLAFGWILYLSQFSDVAKTIST